MFVVTFYINLCLCTGSPPEIFNKPENLTITEGSNARLQCEATGAPKPTVSWKKSKTPNHIWVEKVENQLNYSLPG